MARIDEYFYNTVTRGVRSDTDKFGESQVYFQKVVNYNYDSFYGCQKVKEPITVSPQLQAANIDGIFQYRYVDNTNKTQTIKIAVCNGSIYRDWDTVPSVIHAGLTPGLTQGVNFQNKMFITNGVEFPVVFDGITGMVYQIGAAQIRNLNVPGSLFGTYFYEVTFVTAGGEERIGTRSNTVTVFNSQIQLQLPIGYSGVTSRKIYRTNGSGIGMKLVATVADNTTLTFNDNVADGALGANIIGINNAHPKPKYIEVNTSRLIMTGDTGLPIAVWVGDVFTELVDGLNSDDISLINGDNSPVTGLKNDYTFCVASTERQQYTIDVSSGTPSILATRSNTGFKDGYSVDSCPADGEFPGGFMFLSKLNDFRLFNGNYRQLEPSSLDNLKADNWSKQVKRDIDFLSKQHTRTVSVFFANKFITSFGNVFALFDIRNQGWSFEENRDSTFLTVIDNKLYSGTSDGRIQQMYARISREDYSVNEGKFETMNVLASEELKLFSEAHLFFTRNADQSVIVEIIIDDDEENKLVVPMKISGGTFDQMTFNKNYFDVGQNIEDFKVIHINQVGYWMKVRVKDTQESLFPIFKGVRIIGEGDYVEHAA